MTIHFDIMNIVQTPSSELVQILEYESSISEEKGWDPLV